MRILSFLSFLSFTLFPYPAPAQNSDSTAPVFDILENHVRPGTKLVYAVESDGIRYDLIITVKAANGSKGFDWEMTAPVNKKGSIVHNPRALQTATAMFTAFSGGTKSLDDKTLSIWISARVRNGLAGKAYSPVMMYIDGMKKPGKQMGTFTGAIPNGILVNGRRITIEEEVAHVMVREGKVWVDETGDDTMFAFYNSAAVPIITRIRADFYMALKEIRN